MRDSASSNLFSEWHWQVRFPRSAATIGIVTVSSIRPATRRCAPGSVRISGRAPAWAEPHLSDSLRANESCARAGMLNH